MIHLHTGLPGAGKTLCTLVEVQKRAEKEKRPVFYSGVADLKLPWTEMEKAEAWHTLPDGSIVVVDEAQRAFRPRHTGSAVPEHVAKLETHRHRGFDIYIITQHPKLIDANVRRLVGVHVHFVRAFGAKAVTRHEWGEVQEDPQSRDDSQRQLVPYPKEAFAWYRSAEVHTHKVRLPGRVWLLVAVPLLVGVLGWVAWSSMVRFAETDRITKGAGIEGAGQGSIAPARRQKISATEWLVDRTPRIPGLAHTAPVYDAVTTPAEAPYPAVCMASASKCRCYSQQATRLEMSDELCRRLAERGFFREWRDESQKDQRFSRAGGLGAASPPDRQAFDLVPSSPGLSRGTGGG